MYRCNGIFRLNERESTYDTFTLSNLKLLTSIPYFGIIVKKNVPRKWKILTKEFAFFSGKRKDVK